MYVYIDSIIYVWLHQFNECSKCCFLENLKQKHRPTYASTSTLLNVFDKASHPISTLQYLYHFIYLKSNKDCVLYFYIWESWI